MPKQLKKWLPLLLILGLLLAACGGAEQPADDSGGEAAAVEETVPEEGERTDAYENSDECPAGTAAPCEEEAPVLLNTVGCPVGTQPPNACLPPTEIAQQMKDNFPVAPMLDRFEELTAGTDLTLEGDVPYERSNCGKFLFDPNFERPIGNIFNAPNQNWQVHSIQNGDGKTILQTGKGEGLGSNGSPAYNRVHLGYSDLGQDWYCVAIYTFAQPSWPQLEMTDGEGHLFPYTIFSNGAIGFYIVTNGEGLIHFPWEGPGIEFNRANEREQSWICSFEDCSPSLLQFVGQDV